MVRSIPKWRLSGWERRYDDKPTSVYRVFDVSGVLLYVGCSTYPHARMYEHRSMAPWYPRAARFTVHRYRNRYAALLAEAVAIIEERPTENRQTRPDIVRTRRHLLDEQPVEFRGEFYL